ncbi:MAG TPA: helix-turn-helix transcriptional regulator, partial [Blastocatellia bacterium]|nr:helix-turn-helix transcriptional regulator [Blastocatellia bacterium]
HRNLNTLHPSKNLNIEIEDTFFSNYSLNPAIFDDLAVESAAVKLSMLRVYRECISDDVYSCTVIHSMLLDLIVSHRREKRSGEHPKWVSTVKEIIHDRWNENISLKELSHLANVHPVTISKNFSKYFSCTLGEYLRRVKIEKSLYLISQTEQALTEIALQCGFADQSHFIRTFRAMTGFLPKHFRKL